MLCSVEATIKLKGNDEPFNIRFVGDNYISKDWHIHALATADPVTGEMTPLNAGFISLFVLLSYHKLTAIDREAAEAIYNKLGVHYGTDLTLDDIVNVSSNLKQKLKSFMQTNGYPLPPQPVSTFSDQSLNQRATWWQ